jgi:hypothetical protein
MTLFFNKCQEINIMILNRVAKTNKISGNKQIQEIYFNFYYNNFAQFYSDFLMNNSAKLAFSIEKLDLIYLFTFSRTLCR